jgi:hypothetical protein
MKKLSEMTEEEFNKTLDKIERERKEYLQSEEYRQKLRDKGEQIMRLLIEDNQKAAMNLGCTIRIIERIKDPNFESPRDKEDQERVKEEYDCGERTLKVMKQAKELFNKINEIYYDKK